ncbi:MAG: SAM-dependent chlorinase/fluorinase [Chloroflexota bacterium]|nr:SAM-dependent chlorinase/fluorinase [Chloroflexota bacterium]
MPGIITLCTDFGLRDGYVAAMKGVILSIAPRARLVDISHDIAPQCVREAAFVLRSTYAFFPPGTIHLVVVDPGVGSERRAVAVRAGKHFFVAPDNGVLEYVLRQEEGIEAVSLTNATYWRGEVSATFHGRDIFAPVAAHLARGVPLRDLGERVEDLVHAELPIPERRGDGTIIGHVLYIDGFGNVVTDLPASMLRGYNWRVTAGEKQIIGLSPTYASAAKGELIALIGSHGFLEIAVREGSAAYIAHLSVGDIIQVVQL